MIDFFHKELEFWKNSRGKNTQLITQFVNHFQQCWDQLTAFERSNRESDEGAFSGNWGKVSNKIKAPHVDGNHFLQSESLIGEFIFALFDENPAHGRSAYDFIINQNLDFSNRDRATGYIKAYEFLLEGGSQITKRQDSEVKAIERIRTNMGQLEVDLQAEFDDNILKYNEWREGFTGELEEWKTSLVDKIETWHTERDEQFETFFKASNQKIDDLEKLYTEKLRLEGPVQYWTTRAKELKKAGRWWAGGLTASIIITAATILVVLFIPPDYFSASIIEGDPLAIKGVILFGTLISFLAYLIKTFSRMTFSSFHLMRDAQEREGLTMVYLALLEKGAATEGERELILQAIFSRAETGLIKHESGPSMPGLQGLVDRVNKS